MNEVTIGRVFKTANNRYYHYDILYAKEYGITCPGVVTTNGSAEVLANCVFSMIENAAHIAHDVPDYTVQVYVNNVRYTEHRLLLNELSIIS